MLVNIAGVELGTDIVISVKRVEQHAREVKSPRITRLPLEWESAKSPGLFPFMRGQPSVDPLTATEPRRDVASIYEPPLGVLGGALDTVVGHRIAEALVHRFVSDVASYLRTTPR